MVAAINSIGLKKEAVNVKILPEKSLIFQSGNSIKFYAFLHQVFMKTLHLMVPPFCGTTSYVLISARIDSLMSCDHAEVWFDTQKAEGVSQGGIEKKRCCFQV